MLAIQLSLPEGSPSPTLIFDEVEEASAAGPRSSQDTNFLNSSRRCQVILVTHEGTIAALADSHFMVSKKGESVEAQKLQYGERVKEIARMLSGDSGLPEAVEHARILLSERRGGS